MLRNLLVVLLVCVGQAALAQGIYSWKDASGRVHYSDLPPPEVTVRTVRQAASAPSRAAAPDSTQAAPQSYAEKDLAFRKRRAEAAEAEEKSRKNKAAEDARERDCTEMRRQLAALENGQSFSRFDDAGERTFLDENERNAEIERTRKAMERTCKQ
mgnify:CR=1 FL=1